MAKLRATFLDTSKVRLPCNLDTTDKLMRMIENAIIEMVNEALTCAKDWPVEVSLPFAFSEHADPMTVRVELPIAEYGSDDEDKPTWHFSLSSMIQAEIDLIGDDIQDYRKEWAVVRDSFLIIARQIDEALGDGERDE